MKKASSVWLGSSLLIAVAATPQLSLASDIGDALSSGTTSGNFRLRYEDVGQDNALADASALTLRSLLSYTSGDVNGFSAKLEFEDSRIVFGEDDYSVPFTGFKPGQYSVIADPETTEVDQAFIQYKTDGFTGKFGRQVITLDGHRHVGHVGWRQDKQTFDGVTGTFSFAEEGSFFAGYITQRNRIFAEAADFDSKDILLNASYKFPAGTLVGYAYLLEIDNNTDNALDTFGVSFTGSTGGDTKFLYAAEFATQDNDTGPVSRSADYMMLEGGVVVSGITAKLGIEILGSDAGTYGFSTPLATLHKFNGWADLFLATPGTGLVDTYLSAAYKLASGPAFVVAYHKFEADEDTSTLSSYGDEIDVQVTWAASKNTTVGLKAAMYSADDLAVDTDKLWLWTEYKF